MPESLGSFKRVFTIAQEKELADHLRLLDDMFYGLTRSEVMRLAYQFAEMNSLQHTFNRISEKAGKKWFRSFCARNNFSLRTPEKISAARVSGFNRGQVENFFKHLKELYEKYNFGPERIFNMDESGICVVPHRLEKVVSTTGKKGISKVVAGEKGENVSIVCVMSAAGFPVPPAIIIPRLRHHERFYSGAPVGTLELYNDTGYMSTELFSKWIRHFRKYANPTKDRPILLILDNHVSHINLDLILYCRENDIHLLTLPPHSTHLLQPLDTAFFGPFKSRYSRLCANFAVGKKEYVTVRMENVATLFKEAYYESAKISTAENGFKKTGIYPYCPEKFTDSHFMPSTTTDGKFSLSNGTQANSLFSFS